MPRRPQPKKRNQQAKQSPLKINTPSPFTVCPSGKRGFAEHEARRRLERAQLEPGNRKHATVRRVYPCKLCGTWHLTSKGSP